MAAWSCLGNIRKFNTLGSVIASFKNLSKTKAVNYVPVRKSHERTLRVEMSPFLNLKAKDLMIFYLMIGAIPLIALVTYVNIFIGPAELALIPEGYEPKHWEYHKHPITRFISQYLIVSPQERYERTLHSLFQEKEKHEIRKLATEIKKKMKERLDYQSWYFDSPPNKYIRIREQEKKFEQKDFAHYNSSIEE